MYESAMLAVLNPPLPLPTPVHQPSTHRQPVHVERAGTTVGASLPASHTYRLHRRTAPLHPSPGHDTADQQWRMHVQHSSVLSLGYTRSRSLDLWLTVTVCGLLRRARRASEVERWRREVAGVLV